MSDAQSTGALEAAAAEIEAHVAASGWDCPPRLYALVQAQQLAAADPQVAARLGRRSIGDSTLTPVEQEDLPAGELDEVLAQIAWPASVAGCALSQEIALLPPSAERELAEDVTLDVVLGHPDRRDARLVAAVLRDGTTAVLLRLRGADDDADLLVGPNLAPNLVAALRATLD